MMRAVLWVAMGTVLAAGIIPPSGAVQLSSTTPNTQQRAGSGTLKVRVKQVPAQRKARITVVGLRGKALGQRQRLRVRSSAKLTLPRGTYRLTPRPVVRHERKFWPSPDRRVVTVRPGRTTRATFRFHKPSAPLSFSSVAAGNNLTCGITSRTRGYCWGDNSGSRLGSGRTFTRATTPVPLAAPSRGWTSIAASYLPCGLRTDSRLWCWGTWEDMRTYLGSDTPQPVDAPGFPSIASVDRQCGIAVNGGAWCWGGVGGGVVGRVSDAESLTVASGWVFAGCGLNHSGQAWCWDSQEYDPPGTDRLLPAEPVDPQLAFRQISVSESGTACALTDIGDVWCWQVGSTTPTKVTAAAKFTSVSTGDRPGSACALDTAQHAWCWGRGLPGNTGTPAQVPGSRRFTTISVGTDHACALSGTKAWCWGANPYGQLGDGTTTKRLTPTAVAGPY